MKRHIPTRVVETGRMARGPSGQGVGWVQSLAERLRNIRAQISGVHERLNTPFVNGFPGCVVGEKTFIADTNQIVTIANYPTDPDAIPPIAFVANLQVNPIFLAGQTYRIPIVFSPPGTFRAYNLVVGIEAGFTTFAGTNRQGIYPLNDYRQCVSINGDAPAPGMAPGGGFVSQQADVSCIQYTWQQQVLGDFQRVLTYVPFLWNIIDEKSGRQYAQDLMPHGALLNTRGHASDNTDAGSNAVNPDSELFTFDTPWLFERDAQVSFLFRPIMDLYQIDASSAVLPYGSDAGRGGTDDRTGGRRQEQATVRIEFHGIRDYSAQDALKEGAFVTNSEPRRHPYGLDDTDNG